MFGIARGIISITLPAGEGRFYSWEDEALDRRVTPLLRGSQ